MSDSGKAKVWNGTSASVKVGAEKFLLHPGESMMTFLDDDVLRAADSGVLTILEMPQTASTETKRKKKETTPEPPVETEAEQEVVLNGEITEQQTEDSILPKEDE